MGFLNKIAEWISPKDNMVTANRPGRNEECWCGSGKKYKKCHLDADAEKISKACAINCKTT
ncbi:MAG: SEC-C metal-binding domain-containing protein [Thermodesulfovibrionales bacterium]